MHSLKRTDYSTVAVTVFIGPTEVIFYENRLGKSSSVEPIGTVETRSHI